MSIKRKILQGSASNVARVLLSMLVALVLPPLFVHRMSPPEYGAWVLILQCSAYVNLLELGVQTAVGKFVAEYDALGDRQASSQILSTSFAILCASSMAGAVAVVIVVWQVPLIFHQVPATLLWGLRYGILIVGSSTVLSLPFGAFLAAFTGLQKYGFPTVVAMVGKIASSAALAILLLLHGNLLQLACVMALFNIATAVSQFIGWRRYASERVGFSFMHIHRQWAVRLAKYCSVLSIWTVAMLFISGLDMVIVGHYDFKNTGYYGIATSVTNFMALIVGGLFGPLLPAVSSLQSGRTSTQVGELTIRATRYCVLLLYLVGLPLLLGAYPLLKLWVGQDYARRSELFLQCLVLGNAIRQFGYPYALVVVATGKQKLATIAGVTEAFVNIVVSIYLVQRIGAVGVAIGTLVGAFISLAMHLGLSMRLTRPTISMSRRHFVLQGFLRPSLCIIPSLLLIPLWNRERMLPVSLSWMAAWSLSTLMLVWFTGITKEERNSIRATVWLLPVWRKTRA